MDIIVKSVFVGSVYLVIVSIYGNLPSTKKKLQNLNDQELFQKNEKFKMLWKIFLATGFLSPVILICPLFFISESKIADGYLAILVLIGIFAVTSGMMYLNLARITKGEIEYRKSKKNKVVRNSIF